MQVKELVEIEMTPKDVENLIRDHFSKQFDIKNISFNVKVQYDDFGGSCYNDYVFSGVSIDATNKKGDKKEPTDLFHD